MHVKHEQILNSLAARIRSVVLTPQCYYCYYCCYCYYLFTIFFIRERGYAQKITLMKEFYLKRNKIVIIIIIIRRRIIIMILIINVCHHEGVVGWGGGVEW